MMCQSTATSTCIRLRSLLAAERELASLPLREDRLHLPAVVKGRNGSGDLRSERVAFARPDPLGGGLELLAGRLELVARGADVVQHRRGVGEVGGDVSVDDR